MLKDLGSAAVAFSGGSDSGFLAETAYEALGEGACCVSVVSDVLSARELEEARRTARCIGIKHIEISLDIFSAPNFADNPRDRCYYCKKKIFETILDYAKNHGYAHVCDGTVCDDDNDYRPGTRALRELSITSPLKEAGFYKRDIFELTKNDRPSNSCLAARIPYETPITREKLKQAEQAEDVLFNLGLRIFRVRHHGGLARIELGSGELPPLLENRRKIFNELKNLGFTYVTVDILEYGEHGNK